jgi:hypothetical protein
LQFVRRFRGTGSGLPSFPAPPSSSTPPDVATKISEIQAKVTHLEQVVHGSYRSSSVAHNLDATVRDVQGQLKLLQQRITGNGVQIGTKVFQSFEDVKVWVRTHLPNRRYGLFVDGVSLLDFISAANHTDTEKTFTAFHNQQKTGFASMYEARIALSTQHLFPMVFGRVTTPNLDDCEYLPALPDANRWDSGTTGLRYQIDKSLIDITVQVESAIDTILLDSLEARQIAMECLIESKRFIAELCHFISQDYSKWLHRGHSSKEAWKITSVCVRRVFESLHSERIVARDILDQTDPDFCTAKYLWATWKAHTVMSSYLKSRFYEHQSITAVISRHLADNFVKHDDKVGPRLAVLEKTMEKTTKSVQHMESTLKDLERQVSAMDKVLKGLGPKVDRLEHRQNNRDRNDAKNGGRGGGAQG